MRKNAKIFKQNVQKTKSFRLQSKCDIYMYVFLSLIVIKPKP